jgi:hypothetical protein
MAREAGQRTDLVPVLGHDRVAVDLQGQDPALAQVVLHRDHLALQAGVQDPVEVAALVLQVEVHQVVEALVGETKH